MKKIIFLLLLLAGFLPALHAGKRYWIPNGTKIWNASSRWSTTSGGAGFAGVPGINDTVYFDGNGIGNCTIDTTVNVARFEVGAGYSGTISQGTNAITITGNGIFTGGTFVGGSAAITVSGSLTISGTSFTATSATLTVSGNFTLSSGSYVDNSGTVLFDTPNTVTGTITFYKLTFTPGSAGNYTIANTITVSNDLTLSGSNAITLNTGTITAQGNVIVSNTSTSGGGTATISVTGSGGTQVITGSTTTNAGVLPNLTFTASTSSIDSIVPAKALNVKGTLTLAGSGAITLRSGTIHAQGNISTSNISTGGGGNDTIVLNGTGNQTFSGTGTAGQGRYPHIVIDKSSGTLSLSNVISVNGNWTYTQGGVSAGTSTVAFYGAYNLDAQGSGGTMSFYRFGIAGGTRTLTGNVNANNNITIFSGATFVAGSYSIAIGGRWNNSNGTWTYNTSTVTFTGNGYDDIRHTNGGGTPTTETFYNLALDRRIGTGSVSLGCPVQVNNNLTLTLGRLKTTSTNYLLFVDNATCTVANDSAYVHGPVRKTGDDAFVFPLGDTTLHDSVAYHPLGMTAPSSTGDQFEATYFAVGQTLGDSLVDSLQSISDAEYWKFERKSGSSNVTLTLGWNYNSTSVQDLNALRMGNWNGVKWLDLGAASITVNQRTGQLTAQLTPTYSSSIAHVSFAVPRISVPFALLKKKLDGGYFQADNGSLFFRFDEEYNDSDDKLRFNIYDEQHVLITSDLLQPPTLQPVVQYGDNRYRMITLDCDFSPDGPLTDGFYILEIINEKNERWYLRFKQTTTITLTGCFTPPPTQ